ncbi:uncharacterized protein [Antedon mediterranea]|uniref:uncharacterized protein n=1 Tax=Antedon mediterranea TaxID=105859 RepID=UPI003AF7F6EB
MVNMDSSTTKVSKSVARKINHYLNKERVESEYDPSGKGIHTTNPLMANYELAYLVTTEDEKTKSLLGSDDKDQCSEGEMLVLPCLVPSAQCKRHVRRSDAKRVTSAAHQVISTIPVKEIDMIRRYRPSCRTADTLEMGKVSQMSRSVHAMLNTKQAVDFAVKRDKKTKKLRAKSAYQPRRLFHETSDGKLSGRSDQRKRTISSAKPKKLKQKYTELPFGPGNSSHIASWLSEQKEKEKKAIKKKEKQRKRAEKEAMLEKERRDKEEIVTAMGSLQTDDDNDSGVKENGNMNEKECQKNTNIDKSIERSVKRGKRRKENKNEGKSSDEIKSKCTEEEKIYEKQERNEKQQTPDEKNDRNNNDLKTINNSGQNDISINDDDVNSTAEQNIKVSRRFSDKTDSENDTNTQKSSSIVGTKSRDSKTERSDNEPERRESKTKKNDSESERKDRKTERRDSKTEKSDNEPERRESKTKRRDSKIERRDSKTEKSDSELERRESKTKKNDSEPERKGRKTEWRDSKTKKRGNEPERRESEPERIDRELERRESKTSVRTVEYVRTESLVSLPRS